MAFDLVLFGGTGDLSWRKLMPALFQAFRHGSLPAAGRILAIGRDDLSHAQYRALIRTRFEAVEGAKRPSDEEFEAFSALLLPLRPLLRPRAAAGQDVVQVRALVVCNIVVIYTDSTNTVLPDLVFQRFD